MTLMTLVGQAATHPALPWLVLYIGPDVFLPLASALAAIAGAVMMFWQRLVGWLRSLWRMVFRAGTDGEAQ